VSLAKTVLLGLIAGGTILLGLPIGRMRRPALGARTMLNGVAVGILLFLVWDVLTEAWEPIDDALGKVHDGTGGTGTAVGYGLLFAAGLAVGLLALISYELWMKRSMASKRSGDPVRFGPGAMHVDELRRAPRVAWSPAKRLALLIAVGIGLHNFAEGLAIGQAAATDAIALATMLVIGFGLHNATEGFGIVAPLAGETADDGSRIRPSWGLLLLLGAIAGGPTFIGTIVGHSFTSEPISVLFLTLAAGSILYVVVQLLGVAAKARRTDLVLYGLLIGLLAGFGTDAIVTLAGV
jgi:ZIP family zinc transporter